MQYDWTKNPYYNHYFLGKQKNERGININCKGVLIAADMVWVDIATWNEHGNRTEPYIYIDE